MLFFLEIHFVNCDRFSSCRKKLNRRFLGSLLVIQMVIGKKKDKRKKKKEKKFNNNKKTCMKKISMDSFARLFFLRHRIVLPTLTRRKEKTEKRRSEKRMTETKNKEQKSREKK